MTHGSRRSAAIATLVGNSVTVGITVAQAFLLIPLCLIHVGPTLYGAWLGASELLVWIPLLDAGITNLLTQRVGAAIGRGDREEAARWSSTGLTSLVLLSSALLATGALVGPVVAGWAQVPQHERPVFVGCFRLGVLASILLLLSNGVVALSRGVQRTSLVNATQVAAAVAGLVVAMTLLTAGWRLWALAFGLFVRGLISFTGSVLFLCTLTPAGVSWWARPSRACARDILVLAPSMSGASVGYLLANNSEIFIVTAFFGPVPALVYALTRRAFDGVRSLLDTIAWAVAGGFAHLVTAEDRHRSRAVLEEILWLRLATACLATAVVMAVNRPFVSLLFGAEHFGGIGLTFAFALQVIFGGQSFLANFLLRAMGRVREGSWLLSAEAVARVAAIAGGLATVGLPGAPWGSGAVSVISFAAVRRRLAASLPEPGADLPARRHRATMPITVFTIGVVASMLPVNQSWLAVTVVAAVIGTLGSGALWLTHSSQSGRDGLPRWAQW